MRGENLTNEEKKAHKRPNALSIAGFDPSAGAGILADIKCFEQHQVYGFGACTALTVQTDDEFYGADWMKADGIIDQLRPLLRKFDFAAAKIGLIRDLDILTDVLMYLKKHSDMKLILDPVMKASAGYTFHSWPGTLEYFKPVLQLLDLITPNTQEMKSMDGCQLAQEAAAAWAEYCPVLLKGGHSETERGTDYLFAGGECYKFSPLAEKVYQKHGSGCVLSASVTANLALGFSLPDSCKEAKNYTEQFLNSNPELLGYHS